MRKLLAIAIGAAVLVITPYFLYSHLNPEFEYGAVEMCAAVEGTWEARLEPGKPPVLFAIEQRTAVDRQQSQRGLVRNAAACSHRTLVKSAEACIDVTVMELRITSNGRESEGQFSVHSTVFERGQLRLELGDKQYTATISRTGSVIEQELDGLVGLRRITGPSGSPAHAPATAP